jgi:hypothetical protein
VLEADLDVGQVERIEDELDTSAAERGVDLEAVPVVSGRRERTRKPRVRPVWRPDLVRRAA